MSEVVTVNLDPSTWMWLQISFWVVIGLILGLVCVVIAWGIQEFWFTPLESKTIRKASRKKKPLLILERDDGTLTFQIANKIGPEGILETKPKRKELHGWSGLVARFTRQPHVNVEGINEDEKKATKQKEEIADFLDSLATKKTHLEGARIPALVGYYGKTILTHISHIAGLEVLEKLATANPSKKLYVDLTTIKNLFPMPWDQTQRAAQAQEKYMEGYKAGRKDSGGQETFKMILMMLIVVFGLLVAIVVIMKFL